MFRIQSLCLLVLFSAWPVLLLAEEKDVLQSLALQATSYVRTSACPGEGCEFGRWRVRQDTPLYQNIGDDKPLMMLQSNAHVQVIDGLLHGVAARVKIIQDHDVYQKGDTVYIQDYLGEGVYRVYHQGTVHEDDGLYCIFDSLETKTCGAVMKWAKLESAGVSVWWVKVRLSDGKQGWAKGQDFAGQYANDLDLDDPEVCWWYDPNDRKDNFCRQRGLPSPQEDASVCQGMVLRGFLQTEDCQ